MNILPEHIVALADAILKGERVEGILCDALEEIGLHEHAKHFRSASHRHLIESGDSIHCRVAELIRSNYKYKTALLENERLELESYIERSKVNNESRTT